MNYEKNIPITSEMVEFFGKATGDMNPLHFDEEFAKTTRFKRTVVHGMLTGGLISYCLTDCYGLGTIYLEQDLKFKNPVHVNDVVKIEFYNEKHVWRHKVKLFVIASVNGRNVVEGWARIIKGNSLISVGTTHSRDYKHKWQY